MATRQTERQTSGTAHQTYELSHDEIAHLDDAIAKIEEAGVDPATEDFYAHSWPVESILPAGLWRFLRRFRAAEPAAACMLRGLPVRDDRIGPTPPSWRESSASAGARRETIFLALVASAMGEVFSWSTLQEGRLLTDLLPIAGEESEQSGHGQVNLEWHTEDAFDPHRCRYLLLLGLRNHDRVPTTVASVRDVELSESDRRVLAEERFLILPDDEHLRQLAQRDPNHPGLARMRRMREHPEPVAVLFGDPASPYLRIDPYFMRCQEGDAEAKAALDRLVRALDGALRDVVVDAGSLLIVDNYLAVHGRSAFKARFDGTDRWLKKAIAARDLSFPQELWASESSRVLL